MSHAYQLPPDERVSWVKSIPFLAMHVLPLGALYTGFGWVEVGVCVGLYYLRMFFLTAGYHRYFSHRSYKLGRVMQFVMAFGGSLCAQKGVLWWAAHHRHHHRYSDQPEDVHSPLRGFWWSHMGWILCDKFAETRFELIPDFAKFPELRWINKYWLLPPTLLGAACYYLGGASMLFVGFFLSTALLYHGTFTVNSLAHVFGRRRFVTTDTSRNSMLIALITCGEGWHNNHHHLQSTANQGFYWWELDLSYYVLKVLSWVGLARDLRTPSERSLQRNRLADGHFDIGMFHAYWARATSTLADAQRQAGQFYDAKLKALADAQKQAGEFYDAKVKALADAQRQAGEFYDTKKKAVEDFAAQTLEEAQRSLADAQKQASTYYEAKRRELDLLMEQGRRKAEVLGIVPPEPADADA